MPLGLKILEINAAHPIIKSLANQDDEQAKEVMWLLLDQARVLEGDTVLNPADFTRRLQSFVEKSLVA